MTTGRWTDELLDKLADLISNLSEDVKDNTNAIKQLREENK
jgi:hypothetical protein